MIVTLLTSERLSSLTLPETVGGQYWIRYSDKRTPLLDLISIEGTDGHWQLKSNQRVSILDNAGATVRQVILEPMGIYYLKMGQTGEIACLYTEPATDDRQIFHKYMIEGDSVKLTMGRGDHNDIIFKNNFVSSDHAELVFHKDRFSVTDMNSANGTFVDKKRIHVTDLSAGKTIYIMGLKIVTGHGFIALNDPDGKVQVKASALLPFIPQEPLVAEEDLGEPWEPRYFYRSPRFKREVEVKTFHVDSPPAHDQAEEVPLMLVIGPSMTMGLASLTTGLFAINNALSTGDLKQAIPSILMSAGMLLGTVLWPLLTKQYEKRRKIKNEKQRQTKYRAYLDTVMGRFNDACLEEAEILHENHVTVGECARRIQDIQRNLWERGPGQNDFLTLRMGLGNKPLSADVSYTHRHFLVKEDTLQEEMLAVCEGPRILRNVPMTLSLFEDYISGVIGNPSLVKEFAKGLILQLMSLYSYDEVKLVFLLNEEDRNAFDFVKWLPHAWSDDRQIRFLADTVGDAKEISAYLEKIHEERSGQADHEKADALPYFIIFNLNASLSVRTEVIKQIFSSRENLNFSVISFAEQLKDLPKECSAVVELSEDSGRLFDKDDTSGQFTEFRPDIYPQGDLRDLSVRLANIPLDSPASTYSLPDMISFLEMYGVGKVEHLNALTRWQKNDPTLSLEAAVGVNTLGDEFKLDLHEKFHGPHGLVAGMTGSGKSEFIITFILSLAVNYHPHEVAFILIDYKGGGMAKAFEALPHTAGIITNLDGAEVKRSLISIESELKRRQTIFAQASEETGDSNISIYKYQKLYREGVVTEPLPHLFIISDEFAELKTQQPEFMEQLISAARIGRSLGVHLILATQKPSGVVDDQIWSNSRFRICLKVQERSDSMDMLKRPDAAELSVIGRFYLQVGYNELFEMGQSAWAGAPYFPSEHVVAEKNDSITVIDRTGNRIREMKAPSKQALLFPSPCKQLDAITAYLSDIAGTGEIKSRPLWLPPMPGHVLLEDLRQKYSESKTRAFSLNPVIGEYDDPARQEQKLFRLPLSAKGNAVVYGNAGSGKSNFLTAMAYSLIQEHSPEEVNLYILDFASETLRAFAQAPHVGDVVFSHEEEKVDSLLKMLHREIGLRKQRFSDYGGDYQSYLSSSEDKLPALVVAINNYAVFAELYEEQEDRLSYLAREGVKYGIYFVLTATGVGSVRFRLLQNFSQLFPLQLNDESDYATIIGRTGGLVPSGYKGRGLLKLDDIYEFQVASITEGTGEFRYIQQMCGDLLARWQGPGARPIPLMPDRVDSRYLAAHVRDRTSLQVPVGVEKQNLSVLYYDLASSYIHLVLSAGNAYTGFLGALADLLGSEYDQEVTLIDGPGTCLTRFGENAGYVNQAADIEDCIDRLFDLAVERNNHYKSALESGEDPGNYESKIILINSLSSLVSRLSAEGVEKLFLVLEKGESHYGLTVVIGESVKDLAAFSIEKWFQRHISQGDGIWVGDGFTDQYHLRANKTNPAMYEEMEEGFGFVLTRGRPVKTKMLHGSDEKEESYG